MNECGSAQDTYVDHLPIERKPQNHFADFKDHWIKSDQEPRSADLFCPTKSATEKKLTNAAILMHCYCAQGQIIGDTARATTELPVATEDEQSSSHRFGVQASASAWWFQSIRNSRVLDLVVGFILPSNIITIESLLNTIDQH